MGSGTSLLSHEFLSLVFKRINAAMMHEKISVVKEATIFDFFILGKWGHI